MLKWSKFFQSPEYMSVYRMMTLNDDLRNVILSWIGVKGDTELKILDVGCGTGSFAYYLSKGTKHCKYYGIDIDEDFIACAKSHQGYNNNEYEFQVADAINLPYPDNFFDVVTSYTFLTNMPNGRKALAEMRRVVKTGGTVSSVTTQGFNCQQNYAGIYPISHAGYYSEYIKLNRKINQAYEEVQPIYEYVRYGTAPEKIPGLFAAGDLCNIQLHPLGWSFSLSDASMNPSKKKKYIHLLGEAERNKLKAYLDLPQFRDRISTQEASRYFDLLNVREHMLLSELHENSIWEWYGGAQILVVGIK